MQIDFDKAGGLVPGMPHPIVVISASRGSWDLRRLAARPGDCG